MACRIRRRWNAVAIAARHLPDSGASTAEYAMTLVAACSFAAVLLAIIRSAAVKGLLLEIIKKALSLG